MKITDFDSSRIIVFLTCIYLVPAAYAALYSKEGQVMPAGTDPIRGRDAIQKF